MENGYFVKIITDVLGFEFVEYVGLHREKATAMIGGRSLKMRKIHPYKTMKGAEKYIEAEKRMDELMGKSREFEIVHS